MQGYLQGLSSRFTPPTISFPKSPIFSTTPTPTPPTTPPSSPVFPTTPVLKKQEKYSGYGLTEEENNLVTSKLGEIREGNRLFVLPNLKELLDVFLEGIDTMPNFMLVASCELLPKLLAKSRIDLEYIEERAYEINEIIQKGKKNFNKKMKEQKMKEGNPRKNRKTRRR